MENISFRLEALPPFRLDYTAWALRRRPDNVVDGWDGKYYTRVLVFKGRPIKITVFQRGPEYPFIDVTASFRHKIPKPELKAYLKASLERMLGLKSELRRFYETAEKDRHLGPLVRRFKGLKPPRFPDVFEALVNAIACQQLTLNVGIILLNRLALSFGLPFEEKDKALFAFPLPRDLSGARPDALRGLGFSGQKSRSIIELSGRIVRGELDLGDIEGMDAKEAIERLKGISGIGRWSAEYVMLRGLGRLDLFPGDDVGAGRNLQRLLRAGEKPDYAKIKRITERWQPYQGFMYFHLLLYNLERQGYL